MLSVVFQCVLCTVQYEIGLLLKKLELQKVKQVYN